MKHEQQRTELELAFVSEMPCEERFPPPFDNDVCKDLYSSFVTSSNFHTTRPKTLRRRRGLEDQPTEVCVCAMVLSCTVDGNTLVCKRNFRFQICSWCVCVFEYAFVLFRVVLCSLSCVVLFGFALYHVVLCCVVRPSNLPRAFGLSQNFGSYAHLCPRPFWCTSDGPSFPPSRACCSQVCVTRHGGTAHCHSCAQKKGTITSFTM